MKKHAKPIRNYGRFHTAYNESYMRSSIFLLLKEASIPYKDIRFHFVIHVCLNRVFFGMKCCCSGDIIVKSCPIKMYFPFSV